LTGSPDARRTRHCPGKLLHNFQSQLQNKGLF
jgi:hypothetical protein